MHINFETGPIPFSEVFDLPRLRREIKHPVIEWKDLKTGIEQDMLSCWSTWMAVGGDEKGNPRGSHLHQWLHVGEDPISSS